MLIARAEMFALELKVEGFACKDSSGRKSYTKGRVFKWEVEYGSLTLELLLNHVASELNLCSNQTPTVWFFDKRLNEDCRLVHEIQLLDLFEMYNEEKTCQLVVGVFDNSICVEHEFDALEPLCVVPPMDAAELGNHSNPKQLSSAAPENLEAANKVEVGREASRQPDIFDNAEEYVGIDDEAMYGEVPPTQPTEFAQPQSFDDANANGTDGPSNDFVHIEAEVDDADPLDINVLHDPENPKIVKGELFPDINT